MKIYAWEFIELNRIKSSNLSMAKGCVCKIERKISWPTFRCILQTRAVWLTFLNSKGPFQEIFKNSCCIVPTTSCNLPLKVKAKNKGQSYVCIPRGISPFSARISNCILTSIHDHLWTLSSFLLSYRDLFESIFESFLELLFYPFFAELDLTRSCQTSH